jgi:hypothetical protein
MMGEKYKIERKKELNRELRPSSLCLGVRQKELPAQPFSFEG